MRIFLTGASGFIGGAIAATLSQSHTVIAMSRSQRSDDTVRDLGALPVRCDLGTVEPDHMADCRVVVHCAAYAEQYGPRELFWKVNVEGTRQLLTAAQQAGVGRFIYMGTEAALFHGQDMLDIDETYPYAADTPFDYCETKGRAEQLVLGENGPDFKTISLRPRLVWGPDDRTILPVLVEMVEGGTFMWLDGGRARTSTTHVSNVVHAVTLALDRGQGGEAYFVTDPGVTTIRQFLTQLLATRGLTPPDRSIPGWLARSAAKLIEGTWRLLGLKSEPPLTRLGAALLSRHCTIRIEKARRELGYQPVITREEGLAALAQS